MSLFAVQQQADDDTSLVIEATVAVAVDGWWVFRTADDRPIATLPTAGVCAIDALPDADARGGAWTQDSDDTAVLTNQR